MLHIFSKTEFRAFALSGATVFPPHKFEQSPCWY